MTVLIEALRRAIGDAHVLTEADQTERYLTDHRNQYTGRTIAVVRPATTQEVAALMRLAAEAGVSVVPISGNTSYCGGATADDSGQQLVLSLERLNRIRELDAEGWALSLDAGVILEEAQRAAAEAGLFLPLSLGSSGSAMVGGCVSTNAGGLTALRYGIARDLVLGLEVVLPDGRILDRMLKLRKNNTGYDLRQLWIGAEGTLGIVTGVVLRLFPAHRQTVTGWIALADTAKIMPLLTHLRIEGADLLTTFEILRPGALDCVARLRGTALPVPIGSGGALLIEFATGSSAFDLEAMAVKALEPLIERPEIEDVVLTNGGRQRDQLWQIRETIPEAEKHCGGTVKHDISVPLSAIDEFLREAEALVMAEGGHGGLSVYGHAGDGNIHFNILAPAEVPLRDFTKRIEPGLTQKIYDLAARLGGTFSAEHGIGRLKRPLLDRYGDPVALALMSDIRTALDPANRCNPRSL